MTSLPKASTPRLSVTFNLPSDQAEQAATAELLSQVAQQMQLAFTAFARDREWPQAQFALKQTVVAQKSWSYRAELGGTALLSGELQPGKLLAIGESQTLANLLGLQTVEPFLGMPAKWIAATQEKRARALPLDGLFDQASLVVAHTLHAVSERWSETFGLNQALDWLADVSCAHRALINSDVAPRQGVFLEVLKELVADRLWLPPAEQFLELFAAARAKAGEDLWMLGELLRCAIVPRNLAHWQDHRGTLWAVEWRAQEEDELSLSDRLLRRLQYALGQAPDPQVACVVITDIEHRRGLSQALRFAFPDLPVLSWQELEKASGLEVIAVVDARMEFDPSPWPSQLFELSVYSKNFEK